MPDYDSSKVSVILKSKQTGESWIASGFVKDSRVNVAKGEDAVKLVIGSDGGWCWSHLSDESGTYVLSLLQSSATNDFLSTQLQIQKLTGGGALEVMVKDNLGRSLHFSEEARIQKMPDAEYNEEAGGREWTLLAPEIEDFVGGNF